MPPAADVMVAEHFVESRTVCATTLPVQYRSVGRQLLTQVLPAGTHMKAASNATYPHVH